jgi:hypothetical protein
VKGEYGKTKTGNLQRNAAARITRKISDLKLVWQNAMKAYFVSFALWQITSTARLKAKPKATASHIEDLTTTALIIMMRLKMATITVKAFFSVKYFFIALDLHEVRGRQI